MNSKAYLAIFLAIFMVGIGMFSVIGLSDKDEVSLQSESGGKIGHGINLDEQSTRIDIRPPEVISGTYIPANWDIQALQDIGIATMRCYPVGHAENDYGDALMTGINQNLSLNFSLVRDLGGSAITNITVNWGDGASTSIDVEMGIEVYGEEFEHGYTNNGTYTLQAWFWNSPSNAWTYGVWAVIIYDGTIMGNATWEESGANLVVGTDPVSLAILLERLDDVYVYQMPRGTSEVYNYDPTTGHPYEGSEAYSDDELAQLSYFAFSKHQDLFQMVDNGFSPLGTMLYATYAFNTVEDFTVNAWGTLSNNFGIKPVEMDGINNISASSDPALVSPMAFINVTDAIENGTLTFNDDIDTAWGFVEYDFQDISDQVRPIVDLYISANGGGVTTDGEITEAEAEFACDNMDEDFFADWFGLGAPEDSSSFFIVDGYIYDYIVDSLTGVHCDAQEWYSSEPFQFEIRTTFTSDELTTNKTSHTVTYKCHANSVEWNRTYTFLAPSGWDVLTVTPLDELDADSYDWGNGMVYLNAGDSGNDTLNVVIQREGTTPPDDEDEDEDEDGEGTTNVLTQVFLGLPVWLWLLIVVGVLLVGRKQGWFGKKRR